MRFIGGFFVLVLLACDTDSGSDASAQCHSFVDDYCDRAVECGLTATADDCEAQVSAKLPFGGCDAVDKIDTPEDMPLCLEELHTSACSEFVRALPETCEGQFVVINGR